LYGYPQQLIQNGIKFHKERKTMKKSELKNIIKECVKEVIFEEGVLSGIITEVAQGLQGAQPLYEARAPTPHVTDSRANEAKQKVIAAIGNTGYEAAKQQFSDPTLFEGTQPVPAGDGKGPFSGVAPDDPGVDLTGIPGMGRWATAASVSRK